MSVSSSSLAPSTRLIPVDPRVYCETMNEIHSYITSCKRGYLTQAELFRYYRQRHENAEIPYRLLGYRSLLDLLGSDQRLFTIDLRREPAYVYSAVKLGQEKRERRQGNTSFSRLHHSTNTLGGDQHLFFEHDHVESTDEQEMSKATSNERPLTPNSTRQRFDPNVWHTPQLDANHSLMDKNINHEESNKETIQFVSNPFLPLPTVRRTSDDSTSFVKCETDYPSIQRRILSHHDDYESSSMLKYSSGRLNRSISTSTTSLSKSNSIKSSLISFAILLSFISVGVYLYKCCFS